jgi:DNA polymerase-3 subunit delta
MPARSAARNSAGNDTATRPSGHDGLTLIVGEEELLVERAVKAVLARTAVARTALARPAGEGSADGGPDLHDLRAAELGPGELSMLASPSLFGGEIVVVVRSAQEASSVVATELSDLASALPSDVTLVVTHSGGAKNKSLLAAFQSAGARRVDCPAVKKFGERMDFLRAEFSRAGRKADDSGLRGLLDAVGNDLRDLAGACDQLASDTTGVINAAVVARYWRGRAEATGFSVADRALEGNLSQALAQLRWALAVGTSPVLITSALARGLRTLGQVGSVSRGKSGPAVASELGMPPWMVDKARQQLRGWGPSGLARAHTAVARADAQVKGEGASAGYALEHVIRVIVECRTET